jgi:hypothetical protein
MLSVILLLVFASTTVIASNDIPLSEAEAFASLISYSGAALLDSLAVPSGTTAVIEHPIDSTTQSHTMRALEEACSRHGVFLKNEDTRNAYYHLSFKISHPRASYHYITVSRSYRREISIIMTLSAYSNQSANSYIQFTAASKFSTADTISHAAFTESIDFSNTIPSVRRTTSETGRYSLLAVTCAALAGILSWFALIKVPE